MRRREFISFLGSAAASAIAVCPIYAQQSARPVRRIALLASWDGPLDDRAFRNGLRRHGLVLG
jgi:hypothetical protein